MVSGNLVLTRKIGERIILQDEGSGAVLAELRVSKLKGQSVVLLVQGRTDVKILRGELFDRGAVAAKPARSPFPAPRPAILDAPCLSPLVGCGPGDAA